MVPANFKTMLEVWVSTNAKKHTYQNHWFEVLFTQCMKLAFVELEPKGFLNELAPQKKGNAACTAS